MTITTREKVILKKLQAFLKELKKDLQNVLVSNKTCVSLNSHKTLKKYKSVTKLISGFHICWCVHTTKSTIMTHNL